MSDLSVLTEQYASTARLSQELNEAVVVLKTVCEHLPGAEFIRLDEVEARQRVLAEIITDLAASLEGNVVPQSAPEFRIPSPLLARLHEEHPTDLEYFRGDLKRVARRLNEGLCAVRKEDVSMLDQLAATADAETSRVFRRLTRT